MLCHVIAEIVRKQDHASFAFPYLVVFDVLHGAPDSGATRASHHQSFLLQEAAGPHVTILVPALDPAVGKCSVHSARDIVFPYAFDLEASFLGAVELRGRQYGTNRINGYDLDTRVLLLEFPRDSGERTSSASTDEHVVDLAVTLVPDFFSCFIVVSDRVAGVRVLV